MAFQRAKRDWEALLRVVKHELPMSSLDQFEDVYAFITGWVDLRTAENKYSK